MTQTVLIRLDTLRARASLSSTQRPDTELTQCSEARIEFAFVNASDAVGPLTGTTITVQCCVKARPTDTSSLLLDANCEYNTLTGSAARYIAEWTAETLDGDSLRAFLGSAFSRVGTDQQGPWMEVVWIIDGDTQRVAFPITIFTAWLRPEDAAPDPSGAAAEDWLTARAVRFDEEQDLNAAQIVQALANIGITNIKSMTKTAGGFLEIIDVDDQPFHFGLTSGNAPA